MKFYKYRPKTVSLNGVYEICWNRARIIKQILANISSDIWLAEKTHRGRKPTCTAILALSTLTVTKEASL